MAGNSAYSVLVSSPGCSLGMYSEDNLQNLQAESFYNNFHSKAVWHCQTLSNSRTLFHIQKKGAGDSFRGM